MDQNQTGRFQWVGAESAHLDRPDITTCGEVVIGRYGGRRNAGANKNEDGALVWVGAAGSWELAVLLDAHASSESAELVLATISSAEDAIRSMLSYPVDTALPLLGEYLVSVFRSESFRTACQSVYGSTACLICAHKDQFLWWLNVGDCLLYLLHPELAAFGQFTLNQRNFYEWIGKINTFDLSVPCYSSGVRELRTGTSVIMLCTDGLPDGHPASASQPGVFYTWPSPGAVQTRDELERQIAHELSLVHENQGRDSATVIAWVHHNDKPAAYPVTTRQE